MLLVLRKSCEHSSQTEEETLLQRNDLDCPPQGGPYRLAIVNANPQRLALARRVLEGGAPWRGRKDVWFTPQPMIEGDGERVAFLFPGLEQHFGPVLEDVAAHFDLPCPDLSLAGQSVREHSIALLATGQFLDWADHGQTQAKGEAFMPKVELPIVTQLLRRSAPIQLQ